MKLRQIFEKPIDRPIEGVIKADDLASLKIEVEEYVITNEIARVLSNFFDAYTNYQSANGVWISGFFGSGKSHLLKMLALLLENKMVDGKDTLAYFLPKCGEDAMLRGEMKKAVSSPSKSILFNIDQKADTISKKNEDAVLAVFVKVFNEMRGFYGKQGYIAKFEMDLDKSGKYEQFKNDYQEISGMTWENGREQIILEKENVAKAYAKVSGESGQLHKNIVDAYRDDYRLSIEDFAEQVNEYIQKQAPNFHLNFFVDEAGQYIAENIKLMTNLQTIAESLATKCKGQAWLIVTAQENLDNVLGEMTEQQATDFSKIQARFKTRMKLTSQNVDEVIQKRLLLKNVQGSELITGLYQKNKNNFGTLFDFADGATTYKNFQDEDHFTDCYPFIPYQFTLFQSAIETLSAHNQFEGKHSSVGERSMLGVFQQVALLISDKELGELATFDMMYEGIRASLKTQIQQSVINATNHLDKPFAVQVLKALLLVKYIKGFNATPRNIRVLMQNQLGGNLPTLKKEIEESLGLLEQQTYIQRNGDKYEYLTDEEKDIEQEIKNMGVDSRDTAKPLEDLFFTGIIGENKIRYDKTGYDYPFTKKLDDHIIGSEKELTIHFLTPFYPNVDNLNLIKANSLGKPELSIVLPNDDRLMHDLLTYERTEKYIRLHSTAALPQSARAILSNKRIQNNERYIEIKTRAQDMITRAKIIVSGEEVEVSGQDPRSRIVKGFNELILRTYTNLKMIQIIAFKEEDIEKFLTLNKDSLLASDSVNLNESDQEVLSFININQQLGTRTTLKVLVDKFSVRPYGWYLAAVQCICAKLVGRGKIEARADANILEGPELVSTLRNTHGFGNVILNAQTEFTSLQLKVLKDFYNTYFDRPPSSNDAKALGLETRSALETQLSKLREMAAQISQYPFMTMIKEPIKKLEEIVIKPYSYFLQNFQNLHDEWIKLKEDVLDPLIRFMGGESKNIYDHSRKFLNDQKANFSAIDTERPSRLQAILDDPACFKGSQMKEAKELTESLQKDITLQLKQEKGTSIKRIEQLEKQIKNIPEYSQLNKIVKEEIESSFGTIKNQIEQETLILGIRDKTGKYETEGCNQLLSKITSWTQGGQTEAIKYISKQDLEVKFDKPYLSDDEEIEKYLQLVKSAMQKAIKANQRIKLI